MLYFNSNLVATLSSCGGDVLLGADCRRLKAVVLAGYDGLPGESDETLDESRKEPDADIRRGIGNHHLIFDHLLNIARRSFMSKNR